MIDQTPKEADMSKDLFTVTDTEKRLCAEHSPDAVAVAWAWAAVLACLRVAAWPVRSRGGTT